MVFRLVFRVVFNRTADGRPIFAVPQKLEHRSPVGRFHSIPVGGRLRERLHLLPYRQAQKTLTDSN